MKGLIFTIIFLGASLFVNAPGWADKDIDFFTKNSATYKKILVKRVVKADTIILDNDERIRLIGLKSPDAPRHTRDVERDQYGFVRESTTPWDTLEEQALEFTRKLMEGKYVRLEFDEQRKDDNFTTIAYVFLTDDNTFVNAEILRQGFAEFHINPLNRKYLDQLRKAYQEGHAEMRGLQNE